ncbi:sodium-independent anion transporter, partial [Candidatus Saccharibacteria bacterium]|nr:sodium-independent anion transporter [Candidatus Saccharibacteria bacterium]
HKNAKPIEGILIYRFSAPLFFGNANLFKQTILAMTQTTRPKIKIVIIDASGITNIDSTASNMLQRMLTKLSQTNTEVYIARSIGPVRDRLIKFNIDQKVTFYKTIREAVDAAKR